MVVLISGALSPRILCSSTSVPALSMFLLSAHKTAEIIWNVPRFVVLGHLKNCLLFLSPETAPELHSGAQRTKNTRNRSPAIPNSPTKLHLYVQQLQVVSATCQLVPLRTASLRSVSLRGESVGLAFIPEDTLSNMKTVKSLCLVPKVSFHVQPQYPDGLSVSPETFKADQRHCFRGKPTPCLLDERMRSMIEELR